MNPLCFGKGADNIPGCNCKQIYNQLQFDAAYARFVRSVTEPINMRVEAKLEETWRK